MPTTDLIPARMIGTSLLCDRCGKEIKDGETALVTAKNGDVTGALHEACKPEGVTVASY